MKQGMKSALAICVATAFVAFVACGDPVPVKEMSDAKAQISRALTVKADKYAADLLKIANEQIYKSHDLVMSEKYDEAKTAAELSASKAVDAYNKAVPLLAMDTITAADKSLVSADEAYATQLAASEYAVAAKALQSARDLYDAKKYYESYIAALDADQKARIAQTAALAKKSTLQDAINEVNKTLAEAAKYNVATVSPERVKLAQDSISLAQSSLSNLKIKQGFSAIQVAKINADSAYLEALSVYAQNEISAAGGSIASAEASPYAASSSDEIAAAKAAEARAKQQLTDKQYQESIASSAEAKRISAAVTAKVATATDALNAAVEKKAPLAEEGSTEPVIEGAIIYEGVEIMKDQYGVKVGDYLRLIAKRYYNNEMLWQSIYKVNRDIIKNPDIIQIGWKLRIPVKIQPKTVVPDTAATDAPAAAAEPVQQQVQEPLDNQMDNTQSPSDHADHQTPAAQ